MALYVPLVSPTLGQDGQSQFSMPKTFLGLVNARGLIYMFLA